MPIAQAIKQATTKPMSKDYPVVALGEILSLVQNGIYKKAESYGRGHPFLRMYNVQDNSPQLKLHTLAQVALTEAELEKYSLRTGDILISRVNSFELLGKSAYVNQTVEGYVFENMLIRLQFKLSVEPFFMALQLGTHKVREQIRSFAKKASGQASVNSTDIRNIKVVLPPFSEQKRIAVIASKADRLRQTRRYTQQLSDTYLQSVFLEMFGDPVSNPKKWKPAKVRELGTVQTGNTPRRDNPENYGERIEWIKSDNILVNQMSPTISRERLSEMGEKQGRVVEAGSVLVTCIAGSPTSIGNVSLVDRKVAFNQQINAVTPKVDVDPIFLYGLFLVCKPIIQRSTTLGMKRIITKSKFEQLTFFKPPLPLQKKFATIVKNFERLRTQQREADRQAEHLFQSILHRAFRGEL